MKRQATTLRLLVTAAVFVGGTAIAAAQTTQSPSGGGAMSSPGAAQEHKGGATGGATGASVMPHQQSGASEKSQGATGQSAQEGSRGMAGEKSLQRGAQEERGNQQKGAEEEHGAREKGAQEERSTQQKGAQEERNERGAQTESGKAGAKTQENAQGSTRGGTSVQGSATTNSRGASVQLSKDQRTRISTVIGKSSSTARISGRPDFDVRVGVTVPRSVHVAVLPEDVVTVVPQYRGFDYVMVGDQILIIDPNTYEIVAVIET